MPRAQPSVVLINTALARENRLAAQGDCMGMITQERHGPLPKPLSGHHVEMDQIDDPDLACIVEWEDSLANNLCHSPWPGIRTMGRLASGLTSCLMSRCKF